MSLGPSLVNLVRTAQDLGSMHSLLKREDPLLQRDEPLAAVTGQKAGASTTIDPDLQEALDRLSWRPAGLWNPNRFYNNWGKRDIEIDPAVLERIEHQTAKPVGLWRLSSWLNSWNKRAIEIDPDVLERIDRVIAKPAGSFGLNRYLSAFQRDILDDMKRSTTAELD